MQEEIASVEALARKAHEAIGRVVTAVYNAVLANLSKLAARDTKHGAHFVLENLSALQLRIELLASKVPDIRACRDDLQARCRPLPVWLSITKVIGAGYYFLHGHCMLHGDPNKHREVNMACVQGNLSRAKGKLVEEQMQASKLWPLLSFAGRLRVLLRDVAPSEVQFQVPPLLPLSSSIPAYPNCD